MSAHGVVAQDFATPGTVYQIGLPPRRIDILTEISGASFDDARVGEVAARLGPHTVPCIGLDAMIRNKRAIGRAKDVADAETLEALRERRRSSP